jgi:hypothetical protein
MDHQRQASEISQTVQMVGTAVKALDEVSGQSDLTAEQKATLRQQALYDDVFAACRDNSFMLCDCSNENFQNSLLTLWLTVF